MDMLAVRVELSGADIAHGFGRADGLRPPGRGKVSRAQLRRSSGAADAGGSGKLHGAYPKAGAAGIQAQGCRGIVSAGDRTGISRAAQDSGAGKNGRRRFPATREGRVDLTQADYKCF